MAFMRNGSSAVSFQPTARAPRPARVFAAEEPAGPAKPPASATTIATVTAVSKAAQASVPSPTQAKKVKPPPAPAGKSNALASMWSKAPVTKSNPQAVEAAAAPQGRESGAAGPPVGSSSADKKKKKKLEEEEEEQVASPAIAKRNKKRAVSISFSTGACPYLLPVTNRIHIQILLLIRFHGCCCSMMYTGHDRKRR